MKNTKFPKTSTIKHLVAAFLFLLSLNTGYAQTVLNGDFEINTSSTCEFNLSNSFYSSFMSNSWGIGLKEELDIQTTICGYATPPSNNWFVSLSKIPGLGYDELSLKLSANVVSGNTYQISYLEFGSNLFECFNTPLEFGLSTDSSKFGQQIFSSLPVMNAWTQRNFTFIAPNNGRFITVRIDSGGTTKGWNFIDNIQLRRVTSTNNNALNAASVISPNPTTGAFTVSFPLGVELIQIFNTVGQLVKTAQVNGLTNVDIQLEDQGVYFVHIVTKDNRVTKKIVVHQ